MGARGAVTGIRGRGRAAALLLAVCLALGGGVCLALGASAALAAGTSSTTAVTPPASNPFTPGIPQSSATTPATQTTPTIQTISTSTSGTDSGFSGGGIVAIAIGALVILGGIAFFIWYDARKRAPVRARAVAGGPGMPGTAKPGSKRAPKPRKLSPAERRRRKRGRAR